MAAILNSANLNLEILDSGILVFPLKLTHTCQDWFPSFAQKKMSLTLPSPPFAQKSSLIHSDSTYWWWSSWFLPYWILPSWIQLLHCGIQTPCFLLSDWLKNTLPPLWLWLKLIQSDSNSFILTQLDDGSHLEFSHLGFRNLSFSSQTHSHLPRLVPTICTKKTSLTFPSLIYNLTQTNSIWIKLIHSHWTWWWHPSWIWPFWNQPS